LLSILPTGALSVWSAATNAGLTTLSYSIINVDPHRSTLTVILSGGTGLTTTPSLPSNPTGMETLVTITASVPDSAPYLAKEVLNLGSVAVNGTTATGYPA
jgi:hypothetical protein